MLAVTAGGQQRHEQGGRRHVATEWPAVGRSSAVKMAATTLRVGGCRVSWRVGQELKSMRVLDSLSKCSVPRRTKAGVLECD